MTKRTILENIDDRDDGPDGGNRLRRGRVVESRLEETGRDFDYLLQLDTAAGEGMIDRRSDRSPED